MLSNSLTCCQISFVPHETCCLNLFLTWHVTWSRFPTKHAAPSSYTAIHTSLFRYRTMCDAQLVAQFNSGIYRRRLHTWPAAPYKKFNVKINFNTHCAHPFFTTLTAHGGIFFTPRREINYLKNAITDFDEFFFQSYV